MRKLLIAALSIFFAQSVYSQGAAIVNDPLNFAQLGEVIVQAQEQITVARKQLGFLKETQEFLSKVSSAVMKAELVSDVIDSAEKSIEMIGKLRDMMLKSDEMLSPKYIRMVNTRCQQCVDQVLKTANMIAKILSSEFKMSDSERLMQIRESMNDIGVVINQVNDLEKRTKRLITVRTFLK